MKWRKHIPVAAADIYISPEADAEGEVFGEGLQAVHEGLVAFERDNTGTPPPGVGVVVGEVPCLDDVHLAF